MKRLAAFFLVWLTCSAFNFAVGVYSGDGSDNRDISVSPSFAIDAIIIKCNGTTDVMARTSSIPGDAADALASGGGLTTNRIQSVGTGTFQVGTSSTTNVSGTDNCFYVAFGKDSNNDLAVEVNDADDGSYLGDGLDDRDLVLLPAFQPQFIMILGEHDSGSHFKLDDFSATNSISFAAAGITTNNIQAINSDGFQVGTSTIVNDGTGGTVDYWPVAIKEVAGYTATGTYTATGSPTDDLEITVGFQPDFVLVKNDTNGAGATFRTSAMTGDFSCLFVPTSACVANSIQSFTSNGFTIGTSATVQSASTKYWWYAIKIPVYATSFGPLRRRSQ